MAKEARMAFVDLSGFSFSRQIKVREGKKKYWSWVWTFILYRKGYGMDKLKFSTKVTIFISKVKLKSILFETLEILI